MTLIELKKHIDELQQRGITDESLVTVVGQKLMTEEEAVEWLKDEAAYAIAGHERFKSGN